MEGEIQCGCGCGAWISRKGANGKPRRFLKGHQTKGTLKVRDDSYWVSRLSSLNERAGFCSCGCGERVQISMGWLRERSAQRCVWLPKYREGHMPSKPCGCGCGTLIPSFDERGQARRYLPTHAWKAATPRTGPQIDWELRAQDWNDQFRVCACGCGGLLVRTAEQLREGQPEPEYLQGHNRRRASLVKLDAVELEIIYGTLLGDTSISRPKKTPRLAFTHGLSQLEYARHKTEVLGRLAWWFDPKSVNGGFSDYVVRGSSSCTAALDVVWDVTRSNGPKEVTVLWLNQLSTLSLAYWYMDDGSTARGPKGNITHGALHTEGFSFKENDLICTWLAERFGIKAQVKKTRVYFYIYLPRLQVLRLLELISPMLHPSMAYKGLP